MILLMEESKAIANKAKLAFKLMFIGKIWNSRTELKCGILFDMIYVNMSISYSLFSSLLFSKHILFWRRLCETHQIKPQIFSHTIYVSDEDM